MDHKSRSLAGFGEVAVVNNQSHSDFNISNNTNININLDENTNVNNHDRINNNFDVNGDVIDYLTKRATNKSSSILVGVYLEPKIKTILDRLGQEGGRGAKSMIVNHSLKCMFIQKGYFR